MQQCLTFELASSRVSFNRRARGRDRIRLEFEHGAFQTISLERTDLSRKRQWRAGGRRLPTASGRTADEVEVGIVLANAAARIRVALSQPPLERHTTLSLLARAIHFNERARYVGGSCRQPTSLLLNADVQIGVDVQQSSRSWSPAAWQD